MASSNLTLSGKVFTDPKTGEKMNFLDMSLDDIILLTKIGNINTEDTETLNGKQNYKRRNSVSRRRSNDRNTCRQRGYSRSRNNHEERNHNKKTSKDLSGFKFGQSPLKKQSLIKQEKYNDDYKAQSEKNQGQSERNQHQSEGKSEGNRGQLEENQYHSERSHCQSERSQGPSERSHRQSKRSHGKSERSHGKSERYHFKSERPRGQAERSFDHSERSRGHTEKSRGHSERSCGHSKRSHGQSGRSHSDRERSHGRSWRYQRYPPAGRFKTSPKIKSEFDRSYSKKKRNEYFQKQMQQRNNHINMKRKITPENDRPSDENTGRYERYMKHGVKDLLLTGKYITTKSSLHQPRGIYLDFNFQAVGNQTKMSLNERFSKVKTRDHQNRSSTAEERTILSP